MFVRVVAVIAVHPPSLAFPFFVWHVFPPSGLSGDVLLACFGLSRGVSADAVNAERCLTLATMWEHCVGHPGLLACAMDHAWTITEPGLRTATVRWGVAAVAVVTGGQVSGGGAVVFPLNSPACGLRPSPCCSLLPPVVPACVQCLAVVAGVGAVLRAAPDAHGLCDTRLHPG
jgi:hypothetical protein